MCKAFGNVRVQTFVTFALYVPIKTIRYMNNYRKTLSQNYSLFQFKYILICLPANSCKLHEHKDYTIHVCIDMLIYTIPPQIIV